eukprot:9494619-Pyramimonas_sp.AAC.1
MREAVPGQIDQEKSAMPSVYNKCSERCAEHVARSRRAQREGIQSRSRRSMSRRSRADHTSSI